MSENAHQTAWSYLSEATFSEDLKVFMDGNVWPKTAEGWRVINWTMSPVAEAGGATVGHRVQVWFWYDPDGDGVAGLGRQRVDPD